ncbi:ImmA/IrrE family metallo-endopeptidase [Dyadobacter sp. CY107]|uniref:ImmA/IrrE family metallo-endopeptidase n=1 Tax=Dyadobacter fanqingshengii TaxID=2906443 RepID=UPI001F1F1EA2|nr:ImmA/IrrE family metallo-endopeptidase [Dyadobacter fanqingshengii]MCF2504747.1 ImmA/IrrE family metallo-endopeptidase [Dyadobacter fanqingshengii]
MNKRRQKQIERIALTILRNCFSGNPEKLLVSGGIDVKKVASYLGIELVPQELKDDFPAEASLNTTIGKINHNAKDGLRRYRFMVAQEIGRYVLDRQHQGKFENLPLRYFSIFTANDSPINEDVQEREANAFAAALLMPRDLLIDAVKKAYQSRMPENENYDIIQALADQFEVSKLAMSTRLTNLDLA